MSDLAYPELGKVEDLFKDLVWDVTVKAELEALFASTPWLNVWPLRQIITGIANLITNTLFSKLRLIVDLGAITFVNSEHKRAFDTAMVTLKIIAHDKGIESEEFKKAKDNAKEKFAQFVRFGAV